ncbi:MAG: acyltransferase [Burkholderiales bacterium]|nr:acyltransferase [Burkholderiales bacterium]
MFIIKKLLRRFVFKYLKPQMVLGYHSKDNFLANTRISNITDIVGNNNLTIGNNVFIGHYNFIDASGGITIGEGCQITNYISILTHSSHISIRLYGKHYIENNGKHVGYIRGNVNIGKYTFIGPHSIIMPGTTIGKGSIISAYSYIKAGNYPDFAILSGNPAQVIGTTTDMDKEYLKQNPELNKYYNEWVNEQHE